MGQAIALLNAKRPRDALLSLTAALARFPHHGPLCNLAGECAAAIGDTAQAEGFFRRALAAAPYSARVHFNLARLYAQRSRAAEAEGHYRRAAALAPDNAATHAGLGLLLNAGGRPAEAERCHRRALAIAPHNAALMANMAEALAAQQRLDEAERHYRRAAELDPGQARLTNLANLLARQSRFGEAQRVFSRAIAQAPDDALAHFNYGILLQDLDREEDAQDQYRRALAIDPGHVLARNNLAYLLLRNGHYEEGWRMNEVRYSPDLPPERRFPVAPPLAFPQWRGEALCGRSLLLWTEQGLGDEIQFCRYLPMLKGLGVTRLTMVCQTPLKALLETVDGIDELIAANEFDGAVAPHDYWCYPLSLPLCFNTTLSTIPDRLPYLRVPPERTALWKMRLPSQGLRVGLAWKGSAQHPNDARRSLTLSALAPLWSVPGVRFVSLQKGRDEQLAMHPPSGQPLLALGHEFLDLADTAAVIDQLDLVICVDTSVAHLTGALGRPCWVMLPDRQCDWRWLRGRSDSPWYPRVMRLFRQSRDGEWAPVTAEITRALRELAS